MSEYFIYLILKAEGPNRLSKIVNEALTDGFKLNGPFVIDQSEICSCYLQCVVKDCVSKEDYQVMYDKWGTK